MERQSNDAAKWFSSNGSLLKLVSPEKVKKENKNHTLTKREAEVLQLVAKGFTASEVAEKLFVSLDTVETHKKNIARKLGAKNTIEAVVIAMKRRWI